MAMRPSRDGFHTCAIAQDLVGLAKLPVLPLERLEPGDPKGEGSLVVTPVAWAHSEQNFAVGGRRWPQRVHILASGDTHSAQNLAIGSLCGGRKPNLRLDFR